MNKKKYGGTASYGYPPLLVTTVVRWLVDFVYPIDHQTP